jgi:uncharacterized protein YegP (UPF0339 family)
MTEIVELFPTKGVWRWRFRNGEVALESNESYDTLEEATEAARVAYPNVPMTEVEGEQDTSHSDALGWLALLLIMIVLLRARKAR